MRILSSILILSGIHDSFASTGEPISNERLTRYCLAVTGIADSYCKTDKNPPVCHRSSTACSTEAVLAWESAAGSGGLKTPPVTDGLFTWLLGTPATTTTTKAPTTTTVTQKHRDSYCQSVSKNTLSYCKVTATSAKCHISDKDCSAMTVLAYMLADSSGTTTTTTTLKPSTTSTTVKAATSSSTTTTTTMLGTTTVKAATVATTTAAPVTTSTRSSTVPGPDPCEMRDATLLGRSPTSGDSYYMPMSSLRACMQNTRISHANAIWTLHNLQYGIGETYSFTDLATDSLASEHQSECNHQVHPVKVDLIGDIRGQLAEYNRVLSGKSVAETDSYLNEERSAYEFHAHQLVLINKLHDAHTLYTTPYDMFRVYAPITFGSRMNARTGAQEITLRMSLDPSHPLGRLVYVYSKVYRQQLPIPASYANAVIEEINGMPALDFLRMLTDDDGLLASTYQQQEQRMNAFIFSTSLLVFSQILSPLPDFDFLRIKFTDNRVFDVKLLGQFADLSRSPYYKVPNLRSTAALSTYMHTNDAFNAFIKQESDVAAKRDTLWKYASAAASLPEMHGSHMMSGRKSELWRALSRKHKALLCPVKNMRRDNALNVPVAFDPLAEEEDRPAFASADVLKRIIKNTLTGGSFVGTPNQAPITDSGTPGFSEIVAEVLSAAPVESAASFVEMAGLSYSFVGDMVVVKIPSMTPDSRFDGDQDFYFFPDFVEIQSQAKARGVTRVLFDVTDNGGGYVISAYALLWYTMADQSRICAPVRKRITENWRVWISSFGDGLSAIVDRHLKPKGAALADNIDSIFAEVTALTNLIYDGLGLPAEWLGSATKASALARVNAAKAAIVAKPKPADRAAAIIAYIKGRKFIPPDMPGGANLLPSAGFTPFDPNEMIVPDSRGRSFVPLLSNYKTTERKKWGSRAANYSQFSEYAFCVDVMNEMVRVGAKYDFGYWTEIGFVSDGTCGSACALFTQNIQTNGDAVGFTYGGVANTALDVAAFAGGNVEEYDTFWPTLAFAAKVGHLASGGEAEWSKMHEKSWVSSPIAFPTKAKGRFNWNMMFAEAMGPNALPRQFYIIPGRRHINLWASTPEDMNAIYLEIAKIPAWGEIESQFAENNGMCPLEQRPFSSRRSRSTFFTSLITML